MIWILLAIVIFLFLWCAALHCGLVDTRHSIRDHAQDTQDHLSNMYAHLDRLDPVGKGHD